MRRRAPDLMEQADALGFNHVALDVTAQIQVAALGNLTAWMDQLNQTSVDRFGRGLRVAVPPRQQVIGKEVYELGFIYDADGCLLEFLHKQSELAQPLQSGWDPWDGGGFIGGVLT